MPVAEIRERLDCLLDHGFITGWHKDGRYWLIHCASFYGWYSQTQVSAWIDGANAMGAAP